MASLSFAQISKLLKYEPETGHLFWKARTPDLFGGDKRPASHSCAIWNARYAEKQAFTAKGPKNGYLYGNIYDRSHLAHRVAWILHHGAWPANHIDHINGIRTDNRASNLRDVTRSENNRNMCLSSANTSGAIGVSWTKRTEKWTASIKFEGQEIFLGNYDKFEDAVKARGVAEIKFGFHKNHGRLPA